MRIGEVSRRLGIRVSTIRYYIQTGLLVPNSESAQHQFSEEDCRALELIVQLKEWGLSLDEIHRLVSLRRLSAGVEPEDLADRVALLLNHQDKLRAQCAQFQTYIAEIDEYIDNIYQETGASAAHGDASAVTGVPLQSLGLLCCPCCQKVLKINHANISFNYIYDGILCCDCGYTAEIRSGVIYSSYEHTYAGDTADIDRSLYRSSPNELVSLIQRSYNWMTLRIKNHSLSGSKVIMETHLNSFFYLYKQLKKLGPDHTYIIQDKFPAIIELYKSYIDQMRLDVNVLYIVSSDKNRLPIKAECVDLLIDYNSTNEHGIFSHEFYLEKYREYLKPTGFVIGTYFYFDPNSRSTKALMASYPENHPKNYTLDYFMSGTKPHFRIIEQEEIGISTDSGEGVTFIFHQKDDKLHIRSFLLKHVPDRNK